ncbi:hypothetical protein [Conexibacter sp. DBS9H8]|uniref:hypothetical protein n=1 Tax=Conexibacter sp. DBS9H8 TaxID=2937801 RepID=UPI00200C008F|nr:hypothetical protein [Conexibacter sp. DBS9H8]
MSRAQELTDALRRIGERPAGSDTERRAAVWAATQLRQRPRQPPVIETLWLRPHWAAAQAINITIAVTGSLIASSQPRVGAAVILLGLLSLIADATLDTSLGRLLTPERATQNVLSPAPQERQVRLILTANLDTARIDPDHQGWLPGWVALTAGLTLWLLLSAIAQLEGDRSLLIAVLQIVPTVALIGVATWLTLGLRRVDNAEGVATVLALTRLLDVSPPAHIAVDVLLTGAGSAGSGLTRHLRAHRRERTVTNTVVLGIGPGPGAYYLISDGPLLIAGFFARLRALAAATGRLEARRGRGVSPALPARRRGLPALSIGGEPDELISAALELIDAIDADVGEVQARAAAGAGRRWSAKRARARIRQG